ncbi:MAG TPA: hypothetical protein VMX97_11705 [Hyphomicrobiaceae bacterium]|nr:hypothetical protein [Hyphomicrobiaceae bacterium]
MQQSSIGQFEQSMRVAAVRNKRVERMLERIQRQRERSHKRRRARLFANARNAVFANAEPDRSATALPAPQTSMPGQNGADTTGAAIH